MDKSHTTFKYYRWEGLSSKKEKNLLAAILWAPIIFISIFVCMLIPCFGVNLFKQLILSGALSGTLVQISIMFVILFISTLRISGTVSVDNEGLSIEYTLPLGLSRFFKPKKIIKWQDIIEIKISTPLGRFSVQSSFKSEEDYFRSLVHVQWIIVLRNARNLRIFPFFCEAPNQVLPRTALRSYSLNRARLDIPENLEKLHHLYNTWPFIAEVSKHNVAIPLLTFSSSYLTEDILPTKRLKLGFSLALLLSVAAFMLLPLTKGNHIQSTDTFMMPICAGLFLVLLAIFWMKNDPIKPKWIAAISVSVFLGLALALAFWPLLTMINDLGGEQGYEQSYVINQGVLVVQDFEHESRSCNQNIELPGKQSRWAFLKEGTEIKLMTKKGLLGFCQYNDDGLRLAADAQKIK